MKKSRWQRFKESWTIDHVVDSVVDIALLLFDVITSRLIFPGVRIIRRPWYFRNAGKMKFGKNFTTGVSLRIDVINSGGELIIGNDVQINDYCHIGVSNRVCIGDGTLIASKVFITDHNHGVFKSYCNLSSPENVPILRPIETQAVYIGSNVWLGENVVVLPGVTIGDGSIIGASSVVSKSIPKNVIAVGSPAKVIKVYDFKKNMWVDVN